jgi:hypothetical protein
MLRLVEKQLENYNRGDIEGFCACFHDEIRVEFLISRRPGIQGMTDFKAGYQKQFRENPDLRCELKSRIVLDGAIIDEERVTAAKAFPNGLHTTAIYGFRDGLIDRVWFPS